MKKGLKSCILGVIVLVGICIIFGFAVAAFKQCPPAGPWPTPPWCGGENGQLGIGDDMGCFPPSCALIPDEKGRKLCEDWKNGIVVWPVDCSTVGSTACTALCESDNARIPGKIPIKTFLPSEVDIYGRDWYTKIEDLPLTGTIYAFGPSLQQGMDPFNWLKERGAQVYTGISLWNEDAWKTPDQLPPELNAAYVTGFDNEVLYIQEVVFLNIRNPAYQNWIKARMQEFIDAGVDGFTFDEIQGTSMAVAWGLGGPCDKYSLNGFREYLKDEYSINELQEKGVADIATFDYCTYINDNGYRESYLQDNLESAPFKKDYFAYLQLAANNIIKDLIAFGKTYAAEKGKTIRFGANLNPIERFDSRTFYSLIDTFVFEHEWFPPWRNEGGDLAPYSYGQPVSAGMKYVVSQGKPAAAMYQILDSVEFSQRDVSGGTIMVNHEFAESYANLGYYMYFDLTNYLGLDFHANREMMYPYYTFIREYPQAFKDLHLKTDLAVVMPPHFDTLDTEPMLWAVSASYALSEANLQHDFVDLEKIGDYKVAIVGGKAWSDEEVKIMLDFMDQGGIVIAFDNRFASLNENQEKTGHPQLGGLKTDGAHNYGRGRFIFFSEDMGTRLWRNRDSIEQEKLIGAISQFITADVAPENVQVMPYIGKQRLVVHILNYDFQNKDFVHKENSTIQVHLPEEFSTEGLTMKVVSPEIEGEQVISFEQEGSLLTFTVPSLYIWDVIILE